MEKQGARNLAVIIQDAYKKQDYELLEQHSPDIEAKLVRWLQKKFPEQDKYVLESAAAHATIQIMDQSETNCFTGSTEPEAADWLFEIAQNYVFGGIRWEKREHEGARYWYDPGSTYDESDNRLIEKERRVALREIIKKKLTPREKEVIEQWLKRSAAQEDGKFKDKEIAKAMDITPGRVSQLLSSAFGKFRAEIKRRGLR